MGLTGAGEWSINLGGPSAKLAVIANGAGFASAASETASQAVQGAVGEIKKDLEERGPLYAAAVQSTQAPKAAGEGERVDTQVNGLGDFGIDPGRSLV